MATYTLISSNTLSTTATSVTFSAIPSTYTDLVVRYSARTDNASNVTYVVVQFNGDTATNYSHTVLTGQGSAASSSRVSATATAYFGQADADNATANTYSSQEIYIPSYTASQNKPVSTFGATESNAATGYNIQDYAELWRNTAAITSVVLKTQDGSNFIATSSFFLYGISNA
jgi:hypothetical protein